MSNEYEIDLTQVFPTRDEVEETYLKKSNTANTTSVILNYTNATPSISVDLSKVFTLPSSESNRTITLVKVGQIVQASIQWYGGKIANPTGEVSFNVTFTQTIPVAYRPVMNTRFRTDYPNKSLQNSDNLIVEFTTDGKIKMHFRFIDSNLSVCSFRSTGVYVAGV